MDGGLCMGDNYFLLTNLLSEDERKVITSITAHIERGEKRAGIQQIAAENYLSTASIIKMCKRLGFDGYSELYYHLSRQLTGTDKRTEDTLGSFVDNYSDALVSSFCELLHARRKGKFFTTGEGFSNIVGTYIVQRMSICGFMAFSNVHFYDYMIFQEAQQSADADENDIMFAVSQSGETEPVLNDVRHAKQQSQQQRYHSFFHCDSSNVRFSPQHKQGDKAGAAKPAAPVFCARSDRPSRAAFPSS